MPKKTWHATSQANNNDNHNPLSALFSIDKLFSTNNGNWTMLKIARHSCCEFGSINMISHYGWQSYWTNFALYTISFAVPKLANLYVISEYIQYLYDILGNFEYCVQCESLSTLFFFYFLLYVLQQFTVKWVASRAHYRQFRAWMRTSSLLIYRNRKCYWKQNFA